MRGRCAHVMSCIRMCVRRHKARVVDERSLKSKQILKKLYLDLIFIFKKVAVLLKSEVIQNSSINLDNLI